MAVYDINGDICSSVETAQGIALEKAYELDGTEHTFETGLVVDYDNYSISGVFKKSVSNTQGMDIYDGKVFWVSKSGNTGLEANCYVWDLITGEQALDSPYITIYGGHCNNLSFDYPKLYTSNAYTPNGYVNTFDSSWNATLTRTLYFTDGSISNDCCIDETDKSILWSIGHSGATASTDPFIISKWNLNSLTDNGDGTYTPELLQSVETEKPTCPYFQGCKFHDGIFWYASGYTSEYRAYVYGIDPDTGNVLHTIDTGSNEEPEGISFYPDYFAFGGYALYVGFAGMNLFKITFDSKQEE